MQPFDALSMRAILAEATPDLLNRKVDKIQQISRDEIVISLRSRAGISHLLVSAQASFGRICLVLTPPNPRNANQPAFCQLLRKLLAAATLTGLEQLPGERIADLTFACLDELGNKFTRTLTAEIMGRHSNLILWDNDSLKILACSHNVTQEMSRQREVAAGLKYNRPPRQEKAAIFSINRDEFSRCFDGLTALAGGKTSQQIPSQDSEQIPSQRPEQIPPQDPEQIPSQRPEQIPPQRHGQIPPQRHGQIPPQRHGQVPGQISIPEGSDEPMTYEQWLMANFAGLGRHLAEEIVLAGKLPPIITAESNTAENCAALWRRIEIIQNLNEYKPSMRNDLTCFSVLSWWQESLSADQSEWKTFSTANDLVDTYFRSIQLRTEIQQLKDRIRSELRTEQEKLQHRLQAAEKLLEGARDHDRYRKFGDMILAHAREISAGQVLLDCPDLYSDNGKTLKIELNPNLSASQNAQSYYRLYAKSRTRASTAEASTKDAGQRLAEALSCVQAVESADNMQDLQVLKEQILDRGKKPEQPRPSAAAALKSNDRPAPQRLMSTKSSDGFTIIVGRNRQENDVLVSRLTHPLDIWLHAQGIEGAHVLIKLPNKKDPPLTTLKEAAQIAARYARTGLGGHVKVAYTYGKYVRKIARDKPGLVRYENEKTLEVDTSAPMPASVRRLFT